MKSCFSKILLLSVLTALLTACGESKYEAVTEFDPLRDAAKDIQLAVEEAERSGRHVLLDVGGNWCIWCRKLDAFFEENKDINDFMHTNFVVVKVNWSPENKNIEVLSKYPEIKSYPHLFVLGEDGKLLHSQNTGDLEEGDHHDREKVFAFLKQWGTDKNNYISPR